MYRVPRHCPDPKVVNRHYQNAGMDISTSSGDYLCTACYNLRLKIVHKSEEISTDKELDKVIERMRLPGLEHGVTHADSIQEGAQSSCSSL